MSALIGGYSARMSTSKDAQEDTSRNLDLAAMADSNTGAWFPKVTEDIPLLRQLDQVSGNSSGNGTTSAPTTNGNAPNAGANTNTNAASATTAAPFGNNSNGSNATEVAVTEAPHLKEVSAKVSMIINWPCTPTSCPPLTPDDVMADT